MNSENIGLLELAVDRLGELLGEVVFVGGATVELWITDEAAPEFRPTDDIDVIVEVTTRAGYYSFEERLRAIGFEHDQESGVICRFKRSDSALLLDVMPTEAEILGFSNRWQGEAFPHAVEVPLPSGRAIRAIPPAYLLATKLEAFSTRGEEDFYGSRDFADVVALIDGRAELVEEVSSAPELLREFVAEKLGALREHPSFASGVDAGLAPDPAAQQRADLVVQPRIAELIGSPNAAS
jgi:hypothetical protein